MRSVNGNLEFALGPVSLGRVGGDVVWRKNGTKKVRNHTVCLLCFFMAKGKLMTRKLESQGANGYWYAGRTSTGVLWFPLLWAISHWRMAKVTSSSNTHFCVHCVCMYLLSWSIVCIQCVKAEVAGTCVIKCCPSPFTRWSMSAISPNTSRRYSPKLSPLWNKSWCMWRWWQAAWVREAVCLTLHSPVIW